MGGHIGAPHHSAGQNGHCKNYLLGIWNQGYGGMPVVLTGGGVSGLSIISPKG